MKMHCRSVVIGVVVVAAGLTTGLAAQSRDAQSQESLVRDALQRYQQGLDAIQNGATIPDPTASTEQSGRPIRDLRMDEVVQLALEKNLDISVERLNPQSVDLQIAAIRNNYKPLATSTVGQRDQVRLPSSLLNGGTQVNNTTTTYNFGLLQSVSRWGGAYAVNFSNSRVETSDTFSNFNPTFTTGLLFQYTQPILRGLFIDSQRQQLQVTQINREISEESLRATITQTLANVRNAYWDLVFARNSVDVAQRALELADKLVEDNRARVEVGTLAPLDIVQAEAESANRRQALAVAEAALSTAELALKRFIVGGTEDPLWRQELRPIDLPSVEPVTMDIEGAVRKALERRTDLMTARRNLDSADVTLRYYRNQSLPALDLIGSYGAQGIGGTSYTRTGSGVTSVITGSTPGGYFDSLGLLRRLDYPNWNVQLNLTYNIGDSSADAQYARSRLQKNQSQARLRALELQVATEVTNAALSVQSNLKRVEAAVAARELAEKRLEAEQSKFEVGMSTNFFVVQAQRDLRDAQNAELRALADYRKSLVVFERSQEAPAGTGGTSGVGTGTGTSTTGSTTTTGTTPGGQ